LTSGGPAGEGQPPAGTAVPGTVAGSASVAGSAARRPVSGRVSLSVAALALRLMVLCIDAVITFTSDNGLGQVVIALSALGIIATLGNVRRSAIISSILLWDLGWSIVYWNTIAVHQDYTTFEYSLLAVECVIAAAGDAVLLAWAVTRTVRGHRRSLYLAVFTALGATGNAVAAYAWSLQPCPNRAPWITLGVVLIAVTAAGVLAVRAFPSTAGPAKAVTRR
jgi:hypothetical protein